MRQLLQFLMIAVLFASAGTSSGQGSTTSAMSGKVVDDKKLAIPGATVVAVHLPTGSQYGNVTGLDGYYRIPNMQVGGPYKLTISFVGYKTVEKTDIFLTLGQTFQYNATLSEATTELEELVIVGAKNSVFDGNRTGAETVVGSEQIELLPTVARDLTDFTRLTPQASINGQGDGPSLSIAGQNNRFNSIFIDGAVNNDVFGLADQGTNGGQAGISPISIDAIEQFQVVISPFDVRQGGFAGGGVNAVTRSGTNEFEGSVYYFVRNEGLAGKTPTDNPEVEREKLDEFSAKTYGFRLGGPIIKNKLFFFVNYERIDEQTPQPFDFADYDGTSSVADLEGLRSTLQSKYNYDPGTFLNNPQERTGNKYLAKIDWNINTKHKLTFRYSYVDAEFFRRGRSSSRTINFSKNNAFFPHKTHSASLEVKSTLGSNMSNSLIIGYTSVRDDRDPEGEPFPFVQVNDGNGRINFGGEPFSSANELNQDVLTITDNLELYKGKHTITFGTHNEFYTMDNLFIGRNYGFYEYNSLNDFINESSPIQYRRAYSLVDDKVGDETTARADFKAAQLGFYVQDEFQISSNFKLTGGLRIDIPIFQDPDAYEPFNTSTLQEIQLYYDTQGAKAGQAPKSKMMFSPRVGFNWDVEGVQSTQVRGGIGIFTSRLPFVWIGGTYSNIGNLLGQVRLRSSRGQDLSQIDFRPDVNNQYVATSPEIGFTDPVPSGQLDLFAEDFKIPQMLRTSIAVDKKLPWGLIGTAEFLYTKTLNNVNYRNINLQPATQRLNGADNRFYYSGDRIDERYSNDIFLAYNTNKGYSYNATLQLQKPFENGFAGSLAYTFGRSLSVNDGTSSQNSSQWNRMENINGGNSVEQLTYSDFDVGSRIIASVSYRKEYLKNLATTVSFFYNGQSGGRFSYVYGDQDITNDNFRNVNLIYVPRNESEIVLVSNDDATAAEQWQALDAFISRDDHLSERRGKYAERNGARMPFNHIIDAKLTQDFFVKTSNGQKHNLQLTFDIFNFTNFLNKDWGRRYFVNGSQSGALDLLQFEGYRDVANGDLTPTFSFSDPEDPWDVDDSGINSSRWQAQLGIRYSF